MKSIILLCSLLVVSVSAFPLDFRQPFQVTVALSNDRTGAYAGETFLADNTDMCVQELFGSTAVSTDGQVQATAAQLTAYPQKISCSLRKSGIMIASLTTRHTYADLDWNPNIAVPVNLSNATISCAI